LVANGRSTPVADVEHIAKGRIWTGQQALELGLVDELGGLNDAVNSAAELAGINHYEVVYPSRLLTPYEQFIQEIGHNFSAALRPLGFNAWLPEIVSKKAQTLISPLKYLSEFNDPRNIYLHCENCPM
jgi:protease-4